MNAIRSQRRAIDGVGAGIRWIREWTQPGLIGFRLGRDGDDLVAEWMGIGTLRAPRSGRSHVFTPYPDSGGASMEGIRPTVVEGLLRHLHGKMSLHASAASRGGLAVVLLGDSMAGKSTTVAALCAHEGFEMLADDTVFLDERDDGFYVFPTESAHSLREDAAHFLGASTGKLDKASLPAAALASGPAKVSAFIRLNFEETSSGVLRAMRGSEIFESLNSALFRFIVDDDDVTQADFSRMAALGAAVPFFELRRAPSLDTLIESVRLLRGCVPPAAPLSSSDNP